MTTTTPTASRRAIFAWAMYDFANSGYTTVVLTAIYNAYFVGVIAAGAHAGRETLLWTVAMAIANFIVLITAPVIGAIADTKATKKLFLAVTTIGCVLFTGLLGFAGPGEVALAMTFVIGASIMFAAGENLIAAFLPELVPAERVGRVSGYGWSLGYVGGLLVLAACLAYIRFAEARGANAAQYVPVTLWFTASVFGLAALVTFAWLPETARPQPAPAGGYVRAGFARVRATLKRARHYKDLFRFLITLAVYYCGINTVVVLAAIYAQQEMGFGMQQTILLIVVVNITAALGAFGFGHVQDWIGSVRTLMLVLLIWAATLLLAYVIESVAWFWLVANLVGLALGASQSAGRALIALFAPRERAAEFFGLWGLAGKTAAIVGPLSYGLVTYLSHGNHRLALLATAGFFVAGMVLLAGVDEARGRVAAQA